MAVKSDNFCLELARVLGHTMVMNPLNIKELNSSEEIRKSARIVRQSFKTVALEFSLTKQNCPTHPSFITVKRLNEVKNEGLKFFGVFLRGNQVGFIAIESAQNGRFHIEKLAILPEYRHNGYGREVMRFVLDYIRVNNGVKASLGIIDEHKVLKDWYIKLGFREVGVNNFVHLPFTVCFMEHELF
jgi:diamine N-acetyltransferase